MKILKYIILSMTAMSVLFACQKADSEFLHDDNTISDIYISPVNSPVSTSVTGVINQETGEILFPIPREVRIYYKLDSLRVRANVGYDVKITPSLSGVKDLEEEYPITVTATMTGESKNYTLRAYYAR